jgi:hypothetical protein
VTGEGKKIQCNPVVRYFCSGTVMANDEHRESRAQDIYIGGPFFGPILNWIMRMSGLSRIIFWFCFEYKGYAPKWLIDGAAWLFGLAVGRKPHLVKDVDLEE